MFVPIDEAYVLNAIKQLKNGTAPGLDMISTTLIKDAADFIWKPLTMIFKSSLKYRAFPDIWKLEMSRQFSHQAQKGMETIIDLSLSSQFSLGCWKKLLTISLVDISYQIKY